MENKEFQTVATKVPLFVYERMQSVCKRTGRSMYEVLQKLIELYMLMMDHADEMPEELHGMVQKFQRIAGWRNQFCLADYDQPAQVMEAIYFLRSPKADGTRAVHVTEPYFGEWNANFNSADILEAALSNLSPKVYRIMRLVGAQEECTSAEEIIDILCREYLRKNDPRLKGIDDMFADNDRSDFGIKPTAEPYVQKKTRGMDNEHDRKTILEEDIEQVMERRQTHIDFDNIEEEDGTQ